MSSLKSTDHLDPDDRIIQIDHLTVRQSVSTNNNSPSTFIHLPQRCKVVGHCHVRVGDVSAGIAHYAMLNLRRHSHFIVHAVGPIPHSNDSDHGPIRVKTVEIPEHIDKALGAGHVYTACCEPIVMESSSDCVEVETTSGDHDVVIDDSTVHDDLCCQPLDINMVTHIVSNVPAFSIRSVSESPHVQLSNINRHVNRDPMQKTSLDPTAFVSVAIHTNRPNDPCCPEMRQEGR